MADRRHRAAPILVAVVAVACTSNAAPGTSSSAPSTIDIAALPGKIAFSRAGGTFGDATIFTANANGTNQRRISGFGKNCCPRWSPDGTHLLMGALAPDGRGSTGIFDPHGSLLRTLPLPPGPFSLACNQAWSPATGRLACDSWSETKPELGGGIYTLRASDGGGVVRLTHCSPVQNCLTMGVSPDGSQIYFFRAHPGFPSVGDQLAGSLFAVNADGTNQHRITPVRTPVEVDGRLSKDGRWIVYTSAGAIWIIHPDGSGLKKVFQDTQRRIAITPTWSPDGRFILFGLDPAGSLATLTVSLPNGLYVIRADGTGLTPVIISNDWKRDPDWVAR
jgi:Tol biopolymer transport system component